VPSNERRAGATIPVAALTAGSIGSQVNGAGIPRVAGVRLGNHASEAIHQVYQREKVEDVAQWRDAVSFPCERQV
jgi:hypothetical protein